MPASGVDSLRLHTGDPSREQVHAAQTRLLFENSTTGIIASVVIALVLALAQQEVVPGGVVGIWLLYVLLVCAARFALTRRYWRAAPDDAASRHWNRAFVIAGAMAAAGWAGAAILLHTTGRPLNETFLVFVIGGVMLGGASLLAARPEAFLTFLIPIGLVTSVRLAILGDPPHLMMGSLTALFTAATVATTWRSYRMIAASLALRFDNQTLIQSLQRTMTNTEALNRELELRVRDRTARLTEADQRKDEFLATLAHELRNPLAPIRFALENLKPGAPPSAAARARDVIDRQVRQLVRLVDDLLDVSRITANKMVLRREPYELAKLMTTAVESITPLASAAEHTLTVELPPSTLRVNGDGARLVQVFANILSNSVKFTPRGGRIWFTGVEGPDGAVVWIRDTGVGIGAELLPRVFDMFQQAEPILERSSGGLGIGLTLARRLVEMHDGRIQVRSAGPGQGTEVEIHLPVASAPREERADSGPLAAAACTLRVLIVEDNHDAAEMLDMAIAQLGHATRVAHDGDSALAAVEQFVPDLVLLDIGLPGMSGYSVARALRERPALSTVHLAAVTGWGQDEDRRLAREAGFDSHFTKPLSPVALEQLLNAVAQQVMEGRDSAGSRRTRVSDSGYLV